MNFEILPMSEGQAGGKAYVYYMAWRETGRGLVPNAYLDGRSLEEFSAEMAREPAETLVATVNGRVVGYIDCALPLPDAPAETPKLIGPYILRAYQRYGIGRALLEAGLRRMPDGQIVLFVLQGNERAIGFYRHMGFRLTGRELRHETQYGPLVELEMCLNRT